MFILGDLSPMEPSGIEPLTSCVQSRRSPSVRFAVLHFLNLLPDGEHYVYEVIQFGKALDRKSTRLNSSHRT